MCEASRKKGKKERKKSKAHSGLTARFSVVAKIVASVTANGSEPLHYACESRSTDRRSALEWKLCSDRQSLPLASLRSGLFFLRLIFPLLMKYCYFSVSPVKVCLCSSRQTFFFFSITRFLLLK